MDEQSFTSVEKIIREIGLEHDEEYVYFYRGHSNKEYDLIPSIYRKDEWISNEDKFVRELILRCPEDFSNYKTAFEKLVKMQHYDLPTRLFDVTENPLVALYFACMTNPKKDGELLIFKIPRSEIKYFDSDTVSVLSNIAWMDINFKTYTGIRPPISNDSSSRNRQFNSENNVHATKLLHSVNNEKPHFKRNIDIQHIESVVCVKPMMDNQRLIRQDGAFFLFGMHHDKLGNASVPNYWRFYPKDSRIIIKSRSKQKVLKLLSMMGINKAKLFPEVDQVSWFIKEGLGWGKSEPQVENKRYAKAPKFLR